MAIEFWHGTRLNPSASLGQWTSASEDPWRDSHWLRSGFGNAVLIAWRMVVLDSKLLCAVLNAETAAEKLRHTDYMEAHHWGVAKRRRLGTPHIHHTTPATSSSASFRPPSPDSVDIAGSHCISVWQSITASPESEQEAFGTP